MHPYYENITFDNTNLPILIYKLESEGENNRLGKSINISNHNETIYYNKYECREIHHWHNCLEILYYFKDDVGLIINAEEYSPKKGDVILIDSFDIHKNPNETPDGHYVFLIDPSIIPINVATPIQFPKIFSNKWLKKEGISEKYRINIINSLEKIISLFIKSNNNEKVKLNYYELYSEIYMLLAKLEEYLLDIDSNYVKKVENSSLQREALKKIYSYVAYNYQNEISLKEVSELVGFTENYFCKFFKLSTGLTFLEFLNSYRCQTACNKMETSDKSITTIALDCGFSSVSYFSKVFSNIYGINPRNYRKTLNSTN